MSARDDRNALELLIVAQRFFAIGKTVESMRIAAPVIDRLNDELRTAHAGAIDLVPTVRSVVLDSGGHLDLLDASPYFSRSSLTSVTSISWNKYFVVDDHHTFLGQLVRDGKQYGRLDHAASLEAAAGLGSVASLAASDLMTRLGVNTVVAVPSSTGSTNTLPATVSRMVAQNLGLGALSEHAVKRIRMIPPVKEIWGVEAKLDAVHGCMVADTAEVQGRSIVVIDDLLESGATIGETARALRVAGARDVHGLCLLKTRRYAREMMNS